ncbi:MAG: acyl carrier protein [Bauldia sp.]|nr:acyl carrier protein [Bauldia sp.]
MADVANDVIAIIAKKVPGDKDKNIKLTDNLQELGLESIDALEMVFDLEEKFGIQIPYNANSAAIDFATVGDVATAIQKLVDEQDAKPMDEKPAGAQT